MNENKLRELITGGESATVTNPLWRLTKPLLL